MFKCKFYAFGKKRNSTKIPPASFRFQDEFEMLANDTLDVLHPRLRMQRSIRQVPGYYDSGSHREYNYAYIPALERYYFIENWECKDGIWYCDLSVDALASYKSVIGASDQYIVRSAHTFNSDILDYRYPALCDVKVQHVETSFSWKSTDFDRVIGIFGNGGISYFIASSQAISNFVDYILSDLYAASAVSALGLEAYPEMKATLNPLQYIASLTAFPLDLARGNKVSTVRVGYTDVGVDFYSLPAYAITKTFSVDLPNHPNYDPQGGLNKRDYLQISPFTTLTLSAPPFGLLSIDRYNSTVSKIECQMKLDLRTGSATLQVNERAPQKAILARVNAQVGIPFQLSQVIASGYGAGSAIRDIASVAASAASGNILGAIGSVNNGIGNYLASQIPKATNTGSIGSYDQIAGRQFELFAEFKIPAAEDVKNLGRPLCNVKRVGSIPGYMEIDRPHLDFTGYNEEREMIKQFMSDGFYYE